MAGSIELRGLVLGSDSGTFLMSQMFGGFILRSRGHWEQWNESVSSQYLKGSEFKLCREEGEWSEAAVVQSTQGKRKPFRQWSGVELDRRVTVWHL